MGANPASSRSTSQGTAAAAGELVELVELLDVLWERGKDAAPSAPVSASQLRVLYSLDGDEGMNLRTLGELLGSTAPSVSRLCDRLEAQGFLRRLPSRFSRREVELRLTGRGKTYLYDLRAQRENALLAMIATMTPSARTALLRGLTCFRGALDEARIAGRRRPSAQDTRST